VGESTGRCRFSLVKGSSCEVPNSAEGAALRGLRDQKPRDEARPEGRHFSPVITRSSAAPSMAGNLRLHLATALRAWLLAVGPADLTHATPTHCFGPITGAGGLVTKNPPSGESAPATGRLSTAQTPLFLL